MDDFIRPSSRPNGVQPENTRPNDGLEEGDGPSERPTLFTKDAQDAPEPVGLSAEDIADDETQAGQGAQPPVAPEKKPRFARKHLIAIVAVAVSVVIAGGAFFIMNRPADEAINTSNEVVLEKMSAVVSAVEGDVEFKRGESDWKELVEETDLQKDDKIRTKDDSRAAVTFGDKSIVRLNAATTITIQQLGNERIVVTNEAGQIYARVAQSNDRTFAIDINDHLFTARGTAYKTFNTGDTTGVEVYHNSVKVDETEINEGELYYLDNPDSAKKDKVLPIDIEQLKNDEFIAWCIGQDKDDETYKDELGYLGDFDGPELTIVAPKDGEVITVAEGSNIGAVNVSGKTEKDAKVTVTVKNNNATIDAVVDAVGGFGTGLVSGPIGKVTYEVAARDASGNKTVKTVTVEYKVEIAATPTPDPGDGPVTILSSSFVGGGIKVNWQVNEGADITGGFRIVWDTDAKPTYPEDQSEYAGYDSRIYVIPADKVEDEKTYHIRVCTMKDGTCSGTSYSNEITAVAPKE